MEFPIIVGFDEVETPVINDEDLKDTNQSDITHEKLKTPFSPKMVKERYKLTEQKVEIFHKDLARAAQHVDRKPKVEENSKTERSAKTKPARNTTTEKALQLSVSQLGTTDAQEFDPNLLGRIKITLKPVLKNG